MLTIGSLLNYLGSFFKINKLKWIKLQKLYCVRNSLQPFRKTRITPKLTLRLGLV